ncbi:MAG: Si-specific NAD(P)(+) transhydrogenase [Planctomycetes bacterium]|nr:Si-specific NAD(P)(+) transhydrogenase [Planctomycetota bacterium]
MERFDLVVLGAGPAGHFGAIQAAKAGYSVAVIEEQSRLGGNSTNLGTIPSKSLREATLHLSGIRQRSFYGRNYRVKHVESLADLNLSAHQVIARNTSVYEDQLRRNGVRLYRGHAAFVGERQIVVERPGAIEVLQGEKVLIAVGSRPARPPGLDFDGDRVVDSNQILSLERVPNRLIVVGAGVIGVEYACIFAAIGCQVTLIHDRPEFLDFVDRQLVEVLKYKMMTQGVDFRMNESVVDLGRAGDYVYAHTASHKQIVGDCVLFSGGRQGNTDQINVEAVGLTADSRGRLKVDEFGQTEVHGVYAAGDVIGFPALAATSREQGRRAVCHAFGIGCLDVDTLLPYGIYAIPEISMIGPTEQELTAKSVAYEVGRARYCEIARGQILGDVDGLLKILFDPETLRILAVHVIGEGATELIHIGQAVHALGGDLEYLAEAVFNYPTLAECYKVAALDGINRANLRRRCQAMAKGEPVERDPEEECQLTD